MQRISIHALLAESDPKKNRLPVSRCLFLSTLSLRRATAFYVSLELPFDHFYPRSPCGERRTNLDKFHKDLTFLSTLSLRRATGNESGEDANNRNFYPRSPCGERLRQRN